MDSDSACSNAEPVMQNQDSEYRIAGKLAVKIYADMVLKWPK